MCAAAAVDTVGRVWHMLFPFCVEHFFDGNFCDSSGSHSLVHFSS